MAKEKGTGDPVVTPFVRRYLQGLYAEKVDFKALGKRFKLPPPGMFAVRTGSLGVGAKVRGRYARLMGYPSETALVLAAVRAWVMEHVASEEAPGLAALDGPARDAAVVKLLAWLQGPSDPTDRLAAALHAEPEADAGVPKRGSPDLSRKQPQPARR